MQISATQLIELICRAAVGPDGTKLPQRFAAEALRAALGANADSAKYALTVKDVDLAIASIREASPAAEHKAFAEITGGDWMDAAAEEAHAINAATSALQSLARFAA
ncbi:MAG: hypothetical protein RIQ53_4184 [Pseudomonadota bacterium]|jgi:hypothetical protein